MAVVYENRRLSWKGAGRVSLLTRDERIVVPVVIDAYHGQRLKRVRGPADLIYRAGQFCLAVVVDVPEPPPLQSDDWLGVDVGSMSIGADSDGQTYSGGQERSARLVAASFTSSLRCGDVFAMAAALRHGSSRPSPS